MLGKNILLGAGEDGGQQFPATHSIYDPHSGVAKLRKGLDAHFHHWLFKHSEKQGNILRFGAILRIERMRVPLPFLICDGDVVGGVTDPVRQRQTFLDGMDEGILFVSYTDQQDLGMAVCQLIPAKALWSIILYGIHCDFFS